MLAHKAYLLNISGLAGRAPTPDAGGMGAAPALLRRYHKAMREGKVAAEVIAGQPAAFDVLAVPAVVYTDPQLAWRGLTEAAAKLEGRPVQVGRFPWAASGRATTFDATEGLTKVTFDPGTKRVLAWASPAGTPGS